MADQRRVSGLENEEREKRMETKERKRSTGKGGESWERPSAVYFSDERKQKHILEQNVHDADFLTSD